jgi:hypothetical protein
MATTAVGDEHDDVADFGYWFVQRHKTGVLESHRFQSVWDAVPDPVP